MSYCCVWLLDLLLEMFVPPVCNTALISKGRWKSGCFGFNSCCEWGGGGICEEDIYFH